MRVDEDNCVSWQDTEQGTEVEDGELDWDLGEDWNSTDVEVLPHRYPGGGPRLCVPASNDALFLALEDPQHPAAAGIMRLQSKGVASLQMERSRVSVGSGCLYAYERGEKRLREDNIVRKT